MDAVTKSDNAKPGLLVEGLFEEEKNWQSTDVAPDRDDPPTNKMETPVAVQLPECDALCLWLARLPIQNHLPRSLVFPKDGDDTVFLVRGDDLLVSMFERLTEEGFLGCPVVDVDGVYLSQVDILDIVFYVCSLFKAQYDDGFDSFLVPSSPMRRLVWNDFFELDGFKTARVNHLLTRAAARWVAPRIACQPTYLGCSSLSVLEQMARLGAHRVPVLSESGRVLSLVTQSMFISLFSQQMQRLGRLKDLWVSDLLSTLAPEPYVVKEDSLTINAFKLMAMHSVAGLGVVDSEGYLVGIITVKDLHGIGCKAEYFECLWYPIRLFLQRTQWTTPQPLRTVTTTDTLQTVIQNMDDGNVHLVFVVAQESKNKQRPLHVITQRDVLKVICTNMGMRGL